MTTAITIDGTTIHVQRTSEQETEIAVHHCATRSVAKITATELELRAAGWATSGLSTTDRTRRPILLPGERLGAPLDGARSDERAQGFEARRGTDLLVVDACAGMQPIVLAERGDTADARRLIEWNLGPLS